MSYDLYLYRVAPGADPLQAPRAAFDSVHDPPPQPDAQEWMAALAPRVREQHPRLEMRSGGEGAKAFVLLQSTAGGIEIRLFPTHTSVDVSYWHSGAEAIAVWREAWAYVELLAREIGSRPYDPQLNRVLDLCTDFDAVLAQYTDGVQMLEEILENPPGEG